MRREADKKRAVNQLLSDREWSQSSDREITRCCVVDQCSVGRLRRQLLSGEIPRCAAARFGVAIRCLNGRLAGLLDRIARGPAGEVFRRHYPRRGRQFEDRQCARLAIFTLAFP